MMTKKQSTTLRAKKLGILLRDARDNAGKSKKECGEIIGVSGATIGSFELGRKSPSLPELEVLSFFLDMPIEHFWGNDLTSSEPHTAQTLKTDQIIDLRKRIIGALIRQARTEMKISRKDLSQQTGITSGMLRKYENGERDIPLPELEVLGQILGQPVQKFYNNQGLVSEWLVDQRATQEFLKLPQELKDFISKPINQPYLELAQHLSEMSVDKLRDVAEGLLDITI